jgi:glycosyltransferase involved in cell wall biosynthesis
MVKVSVVIPTYNRASVLPEVVEHVLQQTFQNFDIYILDDGSQDNTPEVLAGLGNPRIRYVRQETSGVAVARNAGRRAAGGEFIALLDSDDLWAHDKLARQVSFLNRHPNINVVCCDLVKFGEESSGPFAHTMPVFSQLLQRYRQGDESVIPRHEMYTCLLEEIPIRPSTFVARRATLTAHAFNPAMRWAEDWELFLRLARREAFGFIDAPLVQLRIWHAGKHVAERSREYAASIHMLKREGASQALTPQQQAALRRGLGQRYYLLGHHLLRQGARLPAVLAFLQGGLASHQLRMLGGMSASLMPRSLYRALQTVRRQIMWLRPRNSRGKAHGSSA